MRSTSPRVASLASIVVVSFFALAACDAPVASDQPDAAAETPRLDASETAPAGAGRIDRATSGELPRWSPLTFNKCACLDLSRVSTCTAAGVCTCYRKSGTDRPCCFINGSCAYTYLCPHWVKYRC